MGRSGPLFLAIISHLSSDSSRHALSRLPSLGPIHDPSASILRNSCLYCRFCRLPLHASPLRRPRRDSAPVGCGGRGRGWRGARSQTLVLVRRPAAHSRQSAPRRILCRRQNHRRSAGRRAPHGGAYQAQYWAACIHRGFVCHPASGGHCDRARRMLPDRTSRQYIRHRDESSLGRQLRRRNSAPPNADIRDRLSPRADPDASVRSEESCCNCWKPAAWQPTFASG